MTQHKQQPTYSSATHDFSTGEYVTSFEEGVLYEYEIVATRPEYICIKQVDIDNDPEWVLPIGFSRIAKENLMTLPAQNAESPAITGEVLELIAGRWYAKGIAGSPEEAVATLVFWWIRGPQAWRTPQMAIAELRYRIESGDVCNSATLQAYERFLADVEAEAQKKGQQS